MLFTSFLRKKLLFTKTDLFIYFGKGTKIKKKKNTATTNPVSRERKTKKNIGGDVGAGSKPEEVFVR